MSLLNTRCWVTTIQWGFGGLLRCGLRSRVKKPGVCDTHTLSGYDDNGRRVDFLGPMVVEWHGHRSCRATPWFTPCVETDDITVVAEEDWQLCLFKGMPSVSCCCPVPLACCLVSL